jgi:hypothetical protein
MNYKITGHLMPWELDYALLSFTQLKKSKYYLKEEDEVFIDSTLNLSSYLINWEESKIPKEFFISKFENLQALLKDYKCRFKIYDGDQLYGGLNTTFESTEDHIDYYMIMNPDMYFNEKLLAHLIEGSKIIDNECFAITPQIAKLWDITWDPISNYIWKDVPHDKWKSLDVFDVRYISKTIDSDIKLTPLNIHKWAGWFDLYNKKTWEYFYSVDGWNGYGPNDLYSMTLAQLAKNQGLDFQQYVLENQIVCEYEIGPLSNGNLSQHYRDMLVLTTNDVPSQRYNFNVKMEDYINEGIKMLQLKGAI